MMKGGASCSGLGDRISILVQMLVAPLTVGFFWGLMSRHDSVKIGQMNPALAMCRHDDVVRLTLDYDAVTLTVHKNGNEVGVAARALTSEFC